MNDLDLLNDFLQEAHELLENTDESLMRLEKDPENKALLNEMFRSFHTLKGGAGFLNLEPIVSLCHVTESLFDLLRSGGLSITPSILDVSLLATEAVKRMLSEYRVNPDAQLPIMIDLIYQVEREMELPSNPSHTEGGADLTLYQKTIELLNSENNNETPPMPNPPSQALNAPTTTVAGSAPSKTTLFNHDKDNTETHIKVDTNRLDAVLTLASEASLAKNRVISSKARILAKDFSDESLADLARACNDLERITSALQGAVMRTRMQPIGRLFAKYPRMTRDLAKQLSKHVELEIQGADTEIDKAMLEDLADPLVHLIRNSLDHGIESPEQRQRLNKSSTGTIRLDARQEGDRIVLTIQDDGAGIDPQRLRQKAKEKQLLEVSKIDAMTDEQALELIFLPGFSTAHQVSSVSGRGVGMDVVKTNINRLGGEVKIQSQLGQGTQIQMILPLTLAVLPALIVLCNTQSLALPLSLVKEILPLQNNPLQKVNNQGVIHLRGETIPALNLAVLLGWESEVTPKVAVLCEIGEQRVALLTDSFMGRDDVMVKPLKTYKPDGVSGVAVDSVGQIVLILDLKSLYDYSTQTA